MLVCRDRTLVGELRRAAFFKVKGQFDVSVIPLALDPLHPAVADPKRWWVMPGDFDIV